MKLLFNGRSRNFGTHTLADRDLSKVRPREKNRLCPREGISVDRESGGIAIHLTSGTRLNGSYRIRIELTRPEIANLMRATFKDMPIRDFLGLFSEPNESDWLTSKLQTLNPLDRIKVRRTIRGCL